MSMQFLVVQLLTEFGHGQQVTIHENRFLLQQVYCCREEHDETGQEVPIAPGRCIDIIQVVVWLSRLICIAMAEKG